MMYLAALLAAAGGLNWGVAGYRMWKDEDKKIATCHDLLNLLFGWEGIGHDPNTLDSILEDLIHCHPGSQQKIQTFGTLQR